MKPDARVIDAFEALLGLSGAERAAALQDWRRREGDAFHEMLARLLAADADGADPLAGIVDSALRELAPSLPRPQQLGPYRLLRELGSGGMGTVFLAERADGAYAQQVAIKLLRGFPTSDGMRRLRQERQILATLDHPCIARLLDGGETAAGQPWLALEYVDGEPLTRWAALHAPSRIQRLQLFEHVLGAVQHAHQRLVVHRDLKPANILVRADGMPRLLDFGIARLAQDSDADDTSTRIMTPAYASPEQQAGRPVTTASDIYSLGILLGELLAATADGGAPLALDAELRGVVARASAADPAQRYASAEAFAEDLARYRQGRPLRASADTRLYRLRKFLRRHRLGTALGLLTLALLGLFVWRLDTERRRAVAAESAAAAALRQARYDAARAGAVNDFLVSLFRTADPNNNRGEKPDARTLLERGAERIGSELKDQPDLRAALQVTLAEALRGLSEYERAEPLVQAAIDATPGTDAAALHLRAERTALLASIRARAGNRVGALQAADQALALLDTAGDGGADLRVSLHNTRAMVLKWLDRSDEAAAALENVLALLPQVQADQAVHRAAALDNLAHVREAQGRWDEAQRTAAQAHAAFLALRGELNPEPQAVAAYAASLHLMRGEPAQARDMYQNVLNAQRKLFNDDDRRLSNTETYLARALLRTGEAAAAQPLLDTALARCDRAGAGRARCPLTVQLLGEWHSIHGDPARGLALLREALALREADKELPARSVQAVRLALGAALCTHGQRNDGQTLVDQALPALQADAHVAPGDRAYFTTTAAACHAPRQGN
jgi:eukaryotic-like serine/threonine-protein kinase